jgi:hypothetical protein
MLFAKDQRTASAIIFGAICTSSTIAAKSGTSSWISPGKSCPSGYEIGRTGPDQGVRV